MLTRRIVAVMYVLLGIAGALPWEASAQTVITRSVAAIPSSLGDIPDGPAGPCPSLSGATRDVTFAVDGLAGAVQQVLVENLFLYHPRQGQLIAQLIAPNGATHDLFGLNPVHAGVNSGYTFADIAPGNWWQAAVAATSGTGYIQGGAYRTSQRGPGGSGALTLMDPVFARLQPNGIWTLRIRDTCGDPPYTGSPYVVTSATLTLVTLAEVQPPSALIASSVVGNTVTLRWTPPTVGAFPTGYVLEGGISPGEVLASIPTGSPSPIFTFTAPTGSYLLRMHAQAGAQRSGPSNEIRLNVNVPIPPSVPASLLGTVDGSSLALAWTNTYTGGTPQSIVLDISGSASASIPIGMVDHVEFGGVPPGTYSVSVRAANAAGSSGPSNAIALATGSIPAVCTGPPLPPANFLAYRSGGTLSLIWDAGNTGPAPSGFVVHATGAAVADVATSARTLSGTVGPGTYGLSVTATNMCGASAATPVQTVTVP